MADLPDDEPETLVQKAVKIGLITIPLMMYVSWAHKKFVPCPKVKYQQGRPSMFKKYSANGKRENKKGKSQNSRPVKQEFKKRCKNSSHGSVDCKRDNCQDRGSAKRNQNEPLCETHEKHLEPSKEKYIDYLKRSTRKCCETVSNHVEGYRNSNKIDQHTSGTNDPCNQHKKSETLSQSNTQSDTISPEALDKLFEQHFQKCVDDFKQHKKRLKEKLEQMEKDSESTQKDENPEANKNGNYLACLTKFNLDKDFECDPHFHSKDSDTPYVVKDYECKSTRTRTNLNDANINETGRTSYLQCLTDLNMDKHFEQKQETESYNEDAAARCFKTKAEDCQTNMQRLTDTCKTDINHKIEDDDDECATIKYDPCEKKAKEEEQRRNESVHNKGKQEETDVHSQAKLDDCGCDPHFNTKDTDKYGTIKGEPCAHRSVREDHTDAEALEDFWHACGPPKGLRTGCRAKGCKDPCDRRK